MEELINIRKARLEDMSGILSIINLLRLDIENFIWGKDDFVERQINNGEYFLAEVGKAPIAIMSLRQRSNNVYIETLAVDENCRMKGVGSKLVEFAKNFAKEKGAYALCACSFFEYNAENFYFYCGFSQKGTGKYENHKFQRFELPLQKRTKRFLSRWRLS